MAPPAGEFAVAGELAAPPHIRQNKDVPLPILIVVTRDIAKGATAVAISRSIEPAITPVGPLPNLIPVTSPDSGALRNRKNATEFQIPIPNYMRVGDFTEPWGCWLASSSRTAAASRRMPSSICSGVVAEKHSRARWRWRVRPSTKNALPAT